MQSPPVRFNWNVFPSTKLEANQMLTPLGCLYSPLHISTLHSSAQPLKCLVCSNYINPYIRIDRPNRMWWCPFCGKTTRFPENYVLPEKDAPNEDIPVEIRPTGHNTIEYELADDISSGKAPPFVAVYVVDVYHHTDALESRDFDKLKESIAKSVDSLPPDTLVMLITFSDVVEVHIPEKNDSVVFLTGLFGKKYDFSRLFTDSTLTKKIESMLQLSSFSSLADTSLLVKNGYLLPVSEKLKLCIDNLRPKLTSSFKPPRSTGLALYLSTMLLSNYSFRNLTGKISLFASGPATLEPGMIVSEEELIRSHHDVANFNAPRFKSASKFYQTLSYISAGYQTLDAYTSVYTSSGKLTNYAVQESRPSFTFDLYAGSLDQVGVYEMKHLAQAGSGNISLSESFASKLFELDLQGNTDQISTEQHRARFTVTTSRGLKVMKAATHGVELQSSYQSDKLSNLHHERISDTVTKFDLSLKKRNFTNQWSLGSLTADDAVAVYFEPETVSSTSMLDAFTGAKDIYIQFRTKFWDIQKNKHILRVTTIKKQTTLAILAANQVKLSSGRFKLINTNSSIIKEKLFMESFDYEAWMVLFTRLLIIKIDTTIGFESFEEVVNDVDAALIRMTKFFGGVKVSTAGTSHNPLENLKLIYSINERFKELPSYSYSLRRNPQLARIFNSSPDETAYYHHLFISADTATSCNMINPKLYRVSSGGKLESVLLDITSLNITEDSAYFVLDSVFNVVVFHQYSDPKRKLALHNSNNDSIIFGDESPREDLAQVLNIINTQLLANRTVRSKVVLTQTGHSQARFLMARLNPVVDREEKPTKSSSWWSFFGGSANDVLMTDDVSVSKYYDELLERVKNFALESDY